MKRFSIRSVEGNVWGVYVVHFVLLVAGVSLVCLRGGSRCHVPKGSRAPATAAEKADAQPAGRRGYGLSGDGGTLVRLDLKRLVVLDAATRDEIRRLELPKQNLRCVAVSPSGDRILAGYSQHGAIVLWDAGQPVVLGEHLVVNTCALAADRGLAATGCGRGLVRVWELATGRQRAVLQLGRTVRCMAFSPDGSELLVGGAHGLLAVCLVDEGRVVRRLVGHEDDVHAVAFSPEGRRALSGGQDGSVRVWDLERGEELWRETPVPSYPILRVAWSPDGRAIACGGIEAAVHVFDAESRRWLSTFWGHAAPIRSLAFLPDGRTVLSAGFGEPPVTWDLKTGQRLERDET